MSITLKLFTCFNDHLKFNGHKIGGLGREPGLRAHRASHAAGLWKTLEFGRFSPEKFLKIMMTFLYEAGFL
jgi:hypothetical protein